MDTLNLKLPDYYINRELSQLAFNVRVLQQAKDPDVPLLERLKFLCISSTNLDEFFEIRVSGLKHRLEVSAAPAGPDNLRSADVLRTIAEQASTLVARAVSRAQRRADPGAARRGHPLREGATIGRPRSAQWLEQYFRTEIVPVLSPTTLDPTRPFPRILNKSLNFIVQPARARRVRPRPASRIVQAPRSLPRLIRCRRRSTATGNGLRLPVVGHPRVRRRAVPRHGDQRLLPVPRHAQQRPVRRRRGRRRLEARARGRAFERRYGAAVRLETAHDCRRTLAEFLLEHFQLAPADLYQVPGPVNLNRLLAIYDLVDRPRAQISAVHARRAEAARASTTSSRRSEAATSCCTIRSSRLRR